MFIRKLILCFVDDLSEERLKELWSTRSKPKVIEVTEAEPVREDGEDVVILVQPETQEVTEEDGFNEEPFVKAAAAFRENKFHGILELLTEAITNGMPCYVILSLYCSLFLVMNCVFVFCILNPLVVKNM